MKKDEVELLSSIAKIEKNQLYLLEQPKTPQQCFLHLFAHRHLLKQKMLNKNIDQVMSLLQGSFAQSSLKLAYTTLCIQNNIQLPQESSPLLNLIHGWIVYYASINSHSKVLINSVVLQQQKSIDLFNGYDVYIAYLNLISVDLWKLIKKNKKESDMFAEKDVKAQLNLCLESNFSHLQAGDLLSFISSCIPKVLLNIVLSKESLPQEMRGKFDKFQCLFSNQDVEYNLRTKVKLSYLLKQILIVLLTLELDMEQQKILMLVSMRYYYVYHFDRKLCANELFIFTFNKVQESVRRLLFEEFVLFFTIISKLGKQKFIDFMVKNSEYMKKIIAIVRNNSMVGCKQESASPYNTVGAGEIIPIGKGESAFRTFQVLQQCSLVYFKIAVESLDITVKLYYLGEITGESTVKKILFTQEKRSGELKTCINAMKKGLYLFEFDNSYSWITAKVIKYQNLVFTPLQIKNIKQEAWIDKFYDDVPQNGVEKDEKIYFITNKKITPQGATVGAQAVTAGTAGTAAVSKNKNVYALKINRQDQQYTYETDSPERLERKIKEVMNEKQKYRWTLMNAAVKIGQIERFITGKQNTSVEVGDQKKEVTQQRILKTESKQQLQEETQYEVVSKEMQKSQIINDGKKYSEFYEQEQERHVPVTKKVKPKVEVKKDQILCNLDENLQFYK